MLFNKNIIKQISIFVLNFDSKLEETADLHKKLSSPNSERKI